MERILKFPGGRKISGPLREGSRPSQNKPVVRQACCAVGKLPEGWGGVPGLSFRDSPLQSLAHGWESVVEVSFELAGHQNVVEEDEDVIHVMGELPDEASFFLAAGPGNPDRGPDPRSGPRPQRVAFPDGNEAVLLQGPDWSLSTTCVRTPPSGVSSPRHRRCVDLPGLFGSVRLRTDGQLWRVPRTRLLRRRHSPRKAPALLQVEHAAVEPAASALRRKPS